MNSTCLSACSKVSQPQGFQDVQKTHHTIILVLCIATLIVSLLFRADETGLYLSGFKWPVRCLLYQTFGIKCTLCGLSRSFCSLAHGNFLDSLKFHILGPLIFAFICLQIPYRICVLTIYPKRINKRLTDVALSLVVVLSTAAFINWLIYIGGLIL